MADSPTGRLTPEPPPPPGGDGSPSDRKTAGIAIPPTDEQYQELLARGRLWPSLYGGVWPTVTLLSDAVTITAPGSLVEVETGITDNLSTINISAGIAGGKDGRTYRIRPATTGHTIVVKHGTGNIRCVGTTDLVLTNPWDICELVYVRALGYFVAWWAGVGIATDGPPTGPAGGDIAGTGASTYPNPTLTAIGAATGPIGSTTVVPVITIDAKGRVTALTSAGIAFPAAPVTSVFGRTGAVVAVANDYTWAQIDKTVSSIADITTKTHSLLTSLTADDHTQYALLANTRGLQTFAGAITVSGVLTTNNIQLAAASAIFDATSVSTLTFGVSLVLLGANPLIFTVQSAGPVSQFTVQATSPQVQVANDFLVSGRATVTGLLTANGKIKMGASPNNIIQDSGGATQITVAATLVTVANNLKASGTLGINATPSTANRVIASTFPNLGAGTTSIYRATMIGIQTANKTGLGNYVAGFDFVNTYDMAGWNLNHGYGALLSPGWADSTGNSNASLHGAAAQINIGSSGGGAAIGADGGVVDWDGFTVLPAFDGSSGFTALSRLAGLRIQDQGGVTFAGITGSISGLEIEAQTAVTVAGGGNFTLKIAGTTVPSYHQPQLTLGAAVAPAASATLDLGDATRALLLTRPTTTQRDAMTAVDGMEVYNASDKKQQVRENGVWAYTNLDVGEFDPGSFTVANGEYFFQYQQLTLSGSEQLTIAGTGQVVLSDLATDAPFVETNVQKFDPGNITIPDNQYLLQYSQLQLQAYEQVTVIGSGQVICFDLPNTSGSLVLAGRGN